MHEHGGTISPRVHVLNQRESGTIPACGMDECHFFFTSQHDSFYITAESTIVEVSSSFMHFEIHTVGVLTIIFRLVVPMRNRIFRFEGVPLPKIELPVKKFVHMCTEIDRSAYKLANDIQGFGYDVRTTMNDGMTRSPWFTANLFASRVIRSETFGENSK